MDASQPPELQTTPLTKYLLLAILILVFLAGVQLYVLSEQTDRYFAWTIQPSLTAAFLGAGYWGALVATFVSLRKRAWLDIRGNVPAALVATSLLLIATLLHLDKFHFNRSELITALAAWVWLIVYVAAPPLVILSLLIQRRRARTRQVEQNPLSAWTRVAFGCLTIISLLIGAGLFLAPDTMAAIWPWKLTILTAQASGAWFAALGATGVTVLAENNFSRLTSTLAGAVAFAILELLALLRYPDAVAWSTPGAWLYTIFLIGVMTLSLYGLFSAQQRAKLAG